MARISSTLGAATWEHVRAKCKTQKYLKFESMKCQKMSQHCSMSGQYLAWPFLPPASPPCCLYSKKPGRKSPALHVLLPSTRDLHAGQLPVDWGCLCITLCAWTQALCQGKQPLDTHETFGRRTRGAPCRADAGMWGQGSSGAGFPSPG